MDDLKQQAQRLKALWKSGRDKYASFFTVLREVRAEIGDARLADWCFDELRIGLPIILRYRELLDVTDDRIVKADLAAAVAADKKERQESAHREALERARKAEEVAAAKAKVALIKAASDAEAARIKAASEVEVTRINSERKKAEDVEKARQQKRKNPNERGLRASAKRAKRALLANIADVDMPGLAKRVLEGEKMCARAESMRADSDVQWIEGSISKAIGLALARGKCGDDDRKFSDWLGMFNIDINHADRAALINLGSLGEQRLREILSNTQSRSYQLIWRDQKPKPTLSVVEN